ncbi:PaREP1 family protein [Pyrodictium abyssi]|uniref:PaREP1 family protein n=1 Tax=Pyrodictium abyssi TaxID=54256 RepID=A0ABN6ZU26_9CREN|nr:PaREP1 family protein [Pyrodictium abyssi]
MGYASARVLEALLEGILALEFLKRGYTRNAAGKAFQAWRALVAALLALEKPALDRLVEDEKSRRRLEETGIPRVPTARLKPLSRLLEQAGYRYIRSHTDKALDLHDYQLHGPDPDLELSKYPGEEEARQDILYILSILLDIIEDRAKPGLEEARAWSSEHEQALRQLRENLQQQQA